MDNDTKLKIEQRIVEVLKTVYDPEIPVDIYNLGLIYRIELADNGELDVDMTLTAPNCPAAHPLYRADGTVVLTVNGEIYNHRELRQKLAGIDGVTEARVHLVFEPEWHQDLMSEEAKMELGFL